MVQLSPLVIYNLHECVTSKLTFYIELTENKKIFKIYVTFSVLSKKKSHLYSYISINIECMLDTLRSFLLKDKEDKTFRCQFFNRIQNMNVETISFRIKVGSPFLSAT